MDGDLQFAKWCLTFSLLSARDVGFEERNCYYPHYFACQRSK